MSIINEALKKTQQKIKPEPPAQSKTSAQADQTPVQAAPSKNPSPVRSIPLVQAEQSSGINKPLVLLAIVICALTVLFFSLRKSTLNPLKPRTVKSLETPRSSSPAAQTTQSLPTNPQTTVVQLSKTSLSVGGIMITAEKNLVLINDVVYEQGEEVDGVKILKIEKNNVVFLDGGVEKAFKIRGR